VDLGLYVMGEAGKRGLVARLPSGERLMGEAGDWLTREVHDTVRSVRVDRNGGDAASLFVDLHPAALPMRLHASNGGAVDAMAVTSAAGPGYHTYLQRLIQRIGTATEVTWTTPEGAAGTTGTTRFVSGSDRAAVEREMLLWLQSALKEVRDAQAGGEHGIQLSLPRRTRFAFDGAVATPLGPRDDAWLATALERPNVAIDVWPWWSDAVDARSLLGRALCLMWTEVRWRPPGDGEAAVMDEVLELLRRAYVLDPSLDYPWAEWAELADIRGLDGALAETVRGRAVQTDRSSIGYRRRPVTIRHEGWSLKVPGSFGERWTSEEWWGGESGRSITLAATTTEADGQPMAAEAFLARFAGDLGDDAIAHADGRVRGRARLTTDASSGVQVGVVEGYSAVEGSGAAIRIVFHDPADWEWAFGMWRSLEHD
jgi:hypothetical protein